MKTPIVSNEIKWLVVPRPEFTDNRATKFCQPVAVPMPPEIGRSTMMSVHLPLNVMVYAGSHRFTRIIAGKLVPYAQLKASFVEPVLMINALKTGRAVMADALMGEMAYGADAGTLFHHVMEIDRSVMLDLSGHIEFTSVGLGYSVLQELLGESTARRMLKTLGIAAVPSSCVAKLPKRITAILHACLPAHLTGEIGILYTQAKILEFFCELTGWLDTLAEPPELKSSDRETLRHLHEELSALTEGKVPTLDELSKTYGRSGKVLNQGFRELFGCSIYTYVSEQRLTQAHEALMSTDAPMKAIAMNLGYTHVNNFINAFRKKFGYTPGSLRK
jgi:AraC-like DNA-binding protein